MEVSQLTDNEIKVVLGKLASMVLLTNQRLSIAPFAAADRGKEQEILHQIKDINDEILRTLNQP